MLEASVRDMLTLACPGCRELMFGPPPLCARSDMQAGRNDHGVFTPRKSENTVYWSFSFFFSQRVEARNSFNRRLPVCLQTH